MDKMEVPGGAHRWLYGECVSVALARGCRGAQCTGFLPRGVSYSWVMDPLALATTFATLLSLVGQYRAEGAARKGADHEQFMTWLMDRNHSEIKGLLEGSGQAVAGVRELLAERDEALRERLDLLDRALAAFASGQPGFRGIVSGLRHEALLSTQAWSILRQFEESGASALVVVTSMEGSELVLVDGTGGVSVEDARFLEDDLRSLADLGLLRRGHTPRGDVLYRYTRAASALLRPADKSA
jgi:hypothetical protein